MAESETGWTKEFPTVTGIYWMRLDAQPFYEPVHAVAGTGVIYKGKHYSRAESESERREYLGPISPSDAQQLVELRQVALTLLENNGGPTSTLEGTDTHVLIRREDFDTLVTLVDPAPQRLSLAEGEGDGMMKTETPQIDWQQVILNGGPPCFHVEGPQYCGRAERWEGHGNKAFHDYVSLDDLLNAERERAFDQGYVCATANIVRLHGADTIARDVLNQNKPKDWSVVDEADKAVLELARGSKD